MVGGYGSEFYFFVSGTQSYRDEPSHYDGPERKTHCRHKELLYLV